MPITTLSPPIVEDWLTRECMKTPEQALNCLYIALPSSVPTQPHHSCIYRHPAKQLLAIGEYAANEAGASYVWYTSD